MSSLNGRKVKSARLHTQVVIHIDGLGQIASILTPDSKRELGALDLTKVEDGVLIKTKNIEALVPTGCFTVICLLPETPAPAKK